VLTSFLYAIPKIQLHSTGNCRSPGLVRLPSLKAIVHKEDIMEQATLSEDGTAVLKLDIK